MKSSSFFVIIIGSILGYLGYKYYYLPKTQTSNQTVSQPSIEPIIITKKDEDFILILFNSILEFLS